MKALYLQPFSHPVLVDIDNSIESITGMLNCDFFECVYISDTVELLCDEMGAYHPYQLPNRKVYSHWILGPILLVGNNDEDFDDLLEEDIDYYSKYFYNTEIELGLGNHIHIKESSN